jgi:hypothetical protein
MQHEAIGHTLGELLHGDQTSPEALRRIDEAFHFYLSAHLAIVHYDKDGNPFLDQFRVCPVFDEQGRPSGHFVGISSAVQLQSLLEAPYTLPCADFASCEPSRWLQPDLLELLDEQLGGNPSKITARPSQKQHPAHHQIPACLPSPPHGKQAHTALAASHPKPCAPARAPTSPARPRPSSHTTPLARRPPDCGSRARRAPLDALLPRRHGARAAAHRLGQPRHGGPLRLQPQGPPPARPRASPLRGEPPPARPARSAARGS